MIVSLTASLRRVRREHTPLPIPDQSDNFSARNKKRLQLVYR
jgi:hypothetical protein